MCCFSITFYFFYVFIHIFKLFVVLNQLIICKKSSLPTQLADDRHGQKKRTHFRYDERLVVVLSCMNYPSMLCDCYFKLIICFQVKMQICISEHKIDRIKVFPIFNNTSVISGR